MILLHCYMYFAEGIFDYFFMDEKVNQDYKADMSLGKLVGYFCCLYWAIWLGNVYYRTKNQRNWNSQSPGIFCPKYHNNTH